MTRTYDMTRRAQSAVRTTQSIADSTEALMASRPVQDVTLSVIAAEAGVTVQTVSRHMGTREGCFRTVAARVDDRVRRQREASSPSDVSAAIASLVAHYEMEGRLMLNLLSQEFGDEPFAAEAVSRGRAYHRDWVQRSWPSCPVLACS